MTYIKIISIADFDRLGTIELLLWQIQKARFADEIIYHFIIKCGNFIIQFNQQSHQYFPGLTMTPLEDFKDFMTKNPDLIIYRYYSIGGYIFFKYKWEKINTTEEIMRRYESALSKNLKYNLGTMRCDNVALYLVFEKYDQLTEYDQNIMHIDLIKDSIYTPMIARYLTKYQDIILPLLCCGGLYSIFSNDSSNISGEYFDAIDSKEICQDIVIYAAIILSKVYPPEPVENYKYRPSSKINKEYVMSIPRITNINEILLSVIYRHPELQHIIENISDDIIIKIARLLKSRAKKRNNACKYLISHDNDHYDLIQLELMTEKIHNIA